MPRNTKYKTLYPSKVFKKHYRKKQKRKEIKPMFVMSLIFLLIISLGTWVVFKTNLFTIQNVKVKGTKNFVSPTDITNLAKEQALRTNILMFNTNKLQKNLLDTFQGAAVISINKKLPKTLIITVTEREPLALIYNNTQPENFLVDKTGYVLGIMDEQKTNLPKIKYEKDLQIGQSINNEVVPVYLELMEALNTEKLNASSISLYPKHIQLFLNTGEAVLIGNNKNKSTTLKFIVKLLKQLSTQGKNAKKIDLRYDKVIVSY